MLILFDIDGTLLHSHGAGRKAMVAAGRQMVGPHFSFEGIEIAGCIDPLIWADAAAAHDVDDAEALHEEFRATYCAIFAEHLRDDPSVDLLPGVTDLVERLAAMDEATLGVLTGNYPESGRAKIRTAGLDPDLFTVTAWGSDGRHRRDLPVVAMQRFKTLTGRAISGERVIVIGDTPHDVDCARANGCHVIAVATGQYARADLDRCAPDLLLDDLSDAESIVGWMSEAVGERPPVTALPTADVPAVPDLAARPVGEGDRIESLDVLRGFAVLGILLLNIQAFAMIGAAYFNPTAYGSFEGVERITWLVVYLLGDQKFMSIFSMLFGAGVIVFTTRREAKGQPALGLHYRRMGWLILFGMLHAYLLWYGDILFIYGMCGLLLYLVRRLPPVWLVILAVVLLVIAAGIGLLFWWSMQFWPPEAMQDMALDWRPPPEMIQAELDAYRGGWLGQMSRRFFDALLVQTFGLFLGGIGLKVLGLMMLGMALFKTQVLSARRSTGFYVGLAVLGYGIGLPLVAMGVWQHFEHEWAMEWSFPFCPAAQFNNNGSVLVALGHIAVVMLVCRALPHSKLLWPLAAVGRMAFTNYIAQTIICTTIFYGHGFGQFGHFDRVQQMMVVGSVWLVQLIWSPLWLRWFRYGPLEWLWRSLSYARIQPMRRKRAGD